MSDQKTISKVDRVVAVLASTGQSMKKENIRQITGITDSIDTLIVEAAGLLERVGLMIVDSGDALELVTHPNCVEYIQKLSDNDTSDELGKASQETLAIVLYRSPVSKDEIDYLRGVNSSQSLRQLEVIGFIESFESEGRTLYKPTTEIMKKMGISSLKDMPQYLEVQEQVDTHLDLIGKSEDVS